MARHHHHHIPAATGDRRLLAAIAVNLALTVAQIIGGVLSGSLALIADAIHNLSDAFALVIAFGARKIARRPASADMSFGYGRAEAVAALINYTTLILLGLYLVSEAVQRFLAPQPVNGWPVVILAGLALVIDTGTGVLTYRMARDSLNIRAAFLHNIADALGSLAVILAGATILLFGWQWVDPLVTLLIAGYILWQSIVEVRAVIRLLMLSTPSGIDPREVVSAVSAIKGVTGVHHAHLWQIGEHLASFDAHVVVEPELWDQAETIRDQVKALLAAQFDLHHSTLELEREANGCNEAEVFGH